MMEQEDPRKIHRWGTQDRRPVWRSQVYVLIYTPFFLLCALASFPLFGALVFTVFMCVAAGGPIYLWWRALSRRELKCDGESLRLMRGARVLNSVELATLARIELHRGQRRTEWSMNWPKFPWIELIPSDRWARVVKLTVFAYTDRDFEALETFLSRVSEEHDLALTVEGYLDMGRFA